MNENNDIYHKIFDLANANLQKHGASFCCSYEAFSVIIGKAPNVVNMDEFAELTGLNSKDYLAAVYLRCLNRLPDDSSYKMCENQETQTEADVQYQILSNVINSAEFAAANKTVTGMRQLRRVCEKEKHCSKAQILRLQIQSVKAKCFGSLMIPIWVKIPNGIRNIVRRIIGRESKPE